MKELLATTDDVRHVYRMILGREPDKEGLRSCIANVKSRSINAVDLAGHFLKSDEYLSKQQVLNELVEVSLGKIKLFPRRGDRSIGAAVAESGTYEPWVIEPFSQSLRPGDIVLDVGANIGIFSFTASRIVGPSGRVTAVEPIPRNLRSIYAAIAGNEAGNISVIPVAASNSDGVAPVSHAESSSTSTIRPEGYSDLYVPTARLDSWLGNLERLDVVKMDIDGLEPLAMEGLHLTIAKWRPVIFMEFFPAGIQAHSVADPWAFAQRLCEYGQIAVLNRDGSTGVAPSAEHLRQIWLQVDSAAHMNGAMHLDLKITPHATIPVHDLGSLNAAKG